MSLIVGALIASTFHAFDVVGVAAAVDPVVAAVVVVVAVAVVAVAVDVVAVVVVAVVVAFFLRRCHCC